MPVLPGGLDSPANAVPRARGGWRWTLEPERLLLHIRSPLDQFGRPQPMFQPDSSARLRVPGSISEAVPTALLLPPCARDRTRAREPGYAKRARNRATSAAPAGK